MSNLAWVDPRVQLVRVAEVQSFLLGRGWKRRPFPGPELLVFEGPVDEDGVPIVQVVPSSEQMRDFQLRVEELIAALSVLENRPTGAILNEMLSEKAATPSAPVAGAGDGPERTDASAGAPIDTNGASARSTHS